MSACEEKFRRPDCVTNGMLFDIDTLLMDLLVERS